MTVFPGKNIVIVVEQEATLRTGLSDVLRREGYEVHTFPSAEEFLHQLDAFSRGDALCVICEFSLPGQGGLQLQIELAELQRMAAFIFYVADASVQDIVSAMQAGAETVLEKEKGVQEVLQLIDGALQHARRSFEAAEAQRTALLELKSLNDGEQQVLTGILEGQLNKEIAQRLNLSVRTIEQRRRQVFRKLNVQHPASLAQKVLQASHRVQMSIRDESEPACVGLRSHVPSPEFRRASQRQPATTSHGADES